MLCCIIVAPREGSEWVGEELVCGLLSFKSRSDPQEVKCHT